MLVTDSGMVKEVSPLHFANALSPIDFTEFGIATALSLRQFLKAQAPIPVTLYLVPLWVIVEGITTHLV
jgi:hypothetical protein